MRKMLPNKLHLPPMILKRRLIEGYKGTSQGILETLSGNAKFRNKAILDPLGCGYGLFMTGYDAGLTTLLKFVYPDASSQDLEHLLKDIRTTATQELREERSASKV